MIGAKQRHRGLRYLVTGSKIDQKHLLRNGERKLLKQIELNL